MSHADYRQYVLKCGADGLARLSSPDDGADDIVGFSSPATGGTGPRWRMPTACMAPK